MWSTVAYYTALFVEGLIGIFGIRLYEEPRYDVIERVADRIEIRRYGPRAAVQVDLQATDRSARDEAFRLLFAYISGNNGASTSDSELIAMTAPVALRDPERLAMTVPVQSSETTDRVQMLFFLPATYTAASAPKPRDPRIRLVTVPGETIAALRFSGTGADLARRQSELVEQLRTSPWRPTGAPYALNYDAPFTIPFFRRNEAAVAVEKRQ